MKIITKNRKAYHDYTIIDEYDAGLVLIGGEVKSIRNAKVNLKDSFVRIESSGAYLHNAHISNYKFSDMREEYDPERKRKLLLNKREIKKLDTKVKERGFSIIPLSVYINDRGLIKIKVALVKGKKFFDKRDVIKKRDLDRDLQREKKDYKY